MWGTLVLFIKKIAANNQLKKEQKKLNKNNNCLNDKVDNKKTKKLKKEIKMLNLSITVSLSGMIVVCIVALLLISYTLMILGSISGYNIISFRKDGDEKEEDKSGWVWENKPDLPSLACPCGCLGASGGDGGYSTGDLTNNGIHKEIIELSMKMYNEGGKVGVPYLAFFIARNEGGIVFTDLSSKYLADLKSTGSIYTGECYTALGWHKKYGGPSKGGGGFGLDYPSGYLRPIPRQWITDLKVLNYDEKIVLGEFTNSDLTFYLPNWLQGTVGSVSATSQSNKTYILKYIADQSKFNNLSNEAKNLVYVMTYYANNYHRAGFFTSPGKGLSPLVAMTQNGKSNIVLDWYCDLAYAIQDGGKKEQVFNIFKNYGFNHNKYESMAKDVDALLGTGTKYYDGIRVYMKNAQIVENTMKFPHLQTDWIIPFKGLYYGASDFETCIAMAGGELIVGGPADGTAGGTAGGTGNSENGVCKCKPDLGCCSCATGSGGTVPLPGDINSVAGVPNGPWWKTSQEMNTDIAKITSSGNKTAMTSLAGDVGKVPATLHKATVDKFKRTDGTGFILYVQSNKIDPWGPKRYGSGVATFGTSGCMYYAAAMIASTMTHTYINPAEFVIATRTLSVRGYKGLDPYVTSSNINNTKALFMSLGLNVWPALHTDYARDKNTFLTNVDKCLDKGGLAYYSVAGGTFTTSTHFLVIREKVGSNYLVGNSSSSNINKEYTSAQMLNGFKSYILVYPPGVTHS